MDRICHTVLLTVLLNGWASCNRPTGSLPDEPKQTTRSKPVGGGCEGCELLFVGMPDSLAAEHTSSGWETGKQQLVVTGRVVQSDGKTPAPGVIIYYWHTDDHGLYTPDSQTPERAKEHGRLRGWVKSDRQGNYTIKTSRPAAYPNDRIPQHIHLAIKEPAIANAYYADLYFDDDPLYPDHRKKYGQIDRAGTELLRIVPEGAVHLAEHTIVLGFNIPDYPANRTTAPHNE